MEIFLPAVSFWAWMIFLDAHKNKLHYIACMFILVFLYSFLLGGEKKGNLGL